MNGWYKVRPPGTGAAIHKLGRGPGGQWVVFGDENAPRAFKHWTDAIAYADRLTHPKARQEPPA